MSSGGGGEDRITYVCLDSEFHIIRPAAEKTDKYTDSTGSELLQNVFISFDSCEQCVMRCLSTKRKGWSMCLYPVMLTTATVLPTALPPSTCNLYSVSSMPLLALSSGSGSLTTSARQFAMNCISCLLGSEMSTNRVCLPTSINANEYQSRSPSTSHAITCGLRLMETSAFHGLKLYDMAHGHSQSLVHLLEHSALAVVTEVDVILSCTVLSETENHFVRATVRVSAFVVNLFTSLRRHKSRGENTLRKAEYVMQNSTTYTLRNYRCGTFGYLLAVALELL